MAGESHRGEELAAFELLSHEVRTPLTVLRGGTEFLERRAAADDDENLRKLVAAMGRATRRIERLLDRIVGGFDGVPSRRIDRLDAALDAVLDELPGCHHRRLVVDVTSEARRAHVVADRTVRILRELVDNAVRFGPSGGEIRIRAEADDAHVRISVADEGPGIDPGDLDRIFEPFRQVDMSSVREHQGVGLGLFTARGLARSLGGDVSVAESVGGLVVTVELPNHWATMRDARGGDSAG